MGAADGVDDELAEVIAEFLAESIDGLDQLDQAFVALEQDPHDGQTLGAVFRSMHSIKGMSGFLGFSRLEALTHAAEDLLAHIRDGQLELSAAATDALLETVDMVRSMLDHVSRDRTDGDQDASHLVARLNDLKDGPESALLPEAAPPPRPLAAGDPGVDGHSPATIRVDVSLLDHLMDLVGELVLARNQILQRGPSDAANAGPIQRLNLITTELQQGVMKTRMQPIDTVWGKFPRVVRDLALTCGKQVHLEMEGRDTELDRSLIEAIKDPLTHLVRNAVDHGIESPEQRAAAGKRREGRLVLRAFHEGGQVNIEIIDDGCGLDVARIREKAISRGLIRSEQADRMSERELTDLVFLPGLSTVDTVTNLSGRGVGLDVVRTNIERIGGSVDVESQAGAGASWRIKIPLTLAILPALVVRSGGDLFAIPQSSVLEMVRVGNDGVGIEWLHNAPVYRLRGSLLPLVYLDREFGLVESDGARRPDSAVNIVVLQVSGGRFGLVVDGVSDTEEIVVKPLGRHLKHLMTFAGATIMGDGRVALILDVAGVATAARISFTADEEAVPDRTTDSEPLAEKESLLVLAVGGSRVAIPLRSVARLEEFTVDQVEMSASTKVVQYRDTLLPLVPLADLIGAAATLRVHDEPITVVVYSVGRRTIGLVVDQVLDIVEEAAVIHRPTTVRGIRGAAVLQGRVTDILDPAVLIGEAALLGDGGDDELAVA